MSGSEQAPMVTLEGSPSKLSLGASFCHHLRGEAVPEPSHPREREAEARGISLVSIAAAQNPAQAKLGRSTLERKYRLIVWATRLLELVIYSVANRFPTCLRR